MKEIAFIETSAPAIDEASNEVPEDGLVADESF